jgi:hypothetical protein
MNLNANGIFSDELNPVEKMIWTGQPQQGLLFRSSDIFVIPFNLFFCGFVIFWEIFAVVHIIKNGSPSFIVAV